MPHNYSREMRYGLVLYGGVSLAIYIDGVVNEFLRMVRGEGVYRLLKWITDTEMIVDIVSGTSAGGINGVFFAHALVNHLDFGQMEQVWRRSGDIARLLRPVGAAAGTYTSLLDSEGYYQPALSAALKTMPPYDGPHPDLSDYELDVFVTGTDMKGLVYTVIDDQGHAIDVKDQRAVFWVKHRPYRTQFQRNDDTCDALARLCRLTSCFPAAFAPVFVAKDKPGPDALLQDWGNLNRDVYFLDGGVLANKPFSHTIEAICSRPVTTPAERILCYVEPDPEHFPPSSGPGAAPLEDPTFFSAAFDGAFNIPTYQSIAEDLKRISEHNAQVDRYRQVCGQLKGNLAALFRGGALPTGTGIPPLLKEPECTIYARARMANMGMRAIRGLAAHKGRKSRLSEAQKNQAQTLVQKLLEMEPRAPQPGRRGVLSDSDSLERFDIYFRLRRLRHVLYYIAERSKQGVTPEAWKRLRAAINVRAQVLEIARYWMEYVMDHILDPDNPEDQLNWLRLDFEQIWGHLRWYMEQFLHQAREVPRDDRDALHRQLGEIAAEVCRTSPTDVLDDPFTGLLELTDQEEAAGFAGAPAEFRAEYDQFVALDAVVFPMEFIADLGGRDFIRVLRLSPVDAQGGFSERELQDKLAGIAVGHFGGFFNRSWRSNDAMWGRLDAISELVKQTLARKRVEEIIAEPALHNKIRAHVGADATRIRELFPNASPGSAHEIFRWIHDLFNPATAHTALARLDEMVKLVTEMAQLEVLIECVPKVVGDMEYEQRRWAPGGDTDMQALVAAQEKEDQARALYTDDVPHDRPEKTKMGNFFLHDYKLAPVNLGDAIPPLGAAETFARAALVLRNCIFGQPDSGWRKAITGSPLFKFGVDWPLSVTYRTAAVWRREPRLQAIMQAVLLFVSLATLIVTYQAGWEFASSNLFLCVLLPLGILLAQYALALRRVSGWIATGAAILVLIGLARYEWRWFEAHFAIVRAVETAVDAFRRAMI